MPTDTDNGDGDLIAGVSIVGIGVAALAAFFVTRDGGPETGPGSDAGPAAASRVQDAFESAAQNLPAPASDPTDATDVVNTIRERADSATDPATGIFEDDLGSGPLGTGGIVSPDDVPADSPLSPYELELADTDSGE